MKKEHKDFWKIVYFFVNVIFIYGVVAPYLVSKNNDILVGVGIGVGILNAFHLFISAKSFLTPKQKSPIIILLIGVLFASCSKVPAGNVGIKFYLLGTNKGVDYEELTPGRYWIGINEELYLFPTFTQNYVWTADEQEGSPNDESFNFQDRQGLELNADVGITYHLNPTKIDLIFQKYKKGISEITDVFLRNMVRDALVSRSSKLDVEYIYGEGRSALIDSVTRDVNIECDDIGIIVDKIYWIGRIKLPPTVKDAIDSKIKATQIAQQRENELREAEAAAKKRVAEAEGIAQSVLLQAEAEAKANRVVSASITATLVEYEKIKKWNGELPQVTGSGATLVNLK